MKKSISFLIIFLFVISSFTPILSSKNFAFAENIDLKLTAKSAILIDFDSEKVVFEKNADVRLPIASMTKIASLSIVFDAIEKGIVKENDMVMISENAASVEGSSAFLDAGSSYKLTDLIKTVIVSSANDSCVALAEYISGSEDVFVSKMNKMAKSFGLSNTNFENSTGLPAENHYSSARDISLIYKSICTNSIFKKYSKIWMDDFIHPSGRKTGLVNTNRLIKTFDGIEGGKTGYTDLAKYCLTASAMRGNTRFIGVVIGVSDSKTRFNEMTTLLNFGFANFENNLVFSDEVPLTVVNVKKSDKVIEVFPERKCQIFSSKSADNKYSYDFKLNDITAPVKKGDVVGKIFVFDKNNMVVDEMNLISKTDIEKEKFKDILNKLVENW